MRATSVLLAVGAMALVGCEKTVDACAGVAAACISVHLDSEVTPLDQLAVRIEGLGTRLTPSPATTLRFPVRFPIELPTSAPSSLALSIDGSREGATLATVAQQITLDDRRHAQVKLTLRAGTVDLAQADDLVGSGGLDLGADLTETPSDLPPSFDLVGGSRLNVFVYGINGGGGQVNVSGATSCGTGCWIAPAGGNVMLSPMPNAGSHLIAVSGDCPFDRSGATCTLAMASERTVFVSFESDAAPANRAFVTPTSYAIADLAAGTLDAACATFAESFDPTVKNSYKALYARTGVDLDSILGVHRGWVRVDGLPFADQLSDIKTDKIQYPILLTSAGAATKATSDVWTGIQADGSAGQTCENWTNSSGNVTLGRPVGGARGWVELLDGVPRCNLMHPVYCFGTAYTNPLTVTVTGPPRRSAFTIADSVGRAPNFGLGGADDACGQAASAALLGGTYRAYLNTTAAGGGLARFDISRGPWTRRDGVLLAASASVFNPLAGPSGASGTSGMLAAFDKDALGQPHPSPNYIWIGGAAGTCSDWTTTLGTAVGNGVFMTAIPSTMPQLPCSSNATLLCLEE